MATTKTKPARAKRRAPTTNRRTARRATTSARQRPTAAAAQRDAIAVLKEDHRELRGLLELLKTARGERRAQMLAKLRGLLTRHTQVEESIYYPAFRAAARTQKDRQMFHEATEEHHTVDVVLPEVERAAGDDDVFKARLKVLCELVHHHMKEEESEMFPRSRELLGAAELRDAGARIEEARRALNPGRSVNPFRAVASLVGMGR